MMISKICHLANMATTTKITVAYPPFKLTLCYYHCYAAEIVDSPLGLPLSDY